MAPHRKYFTEEERKQAHRDVCKQYEYNNPKSHRASKLLSSYNTMDKKRGFPKGDLTGRWILENILSKPCAHCGVCGWDIIGCNRLDNSKPHTKDNVEPCCFDCNNQLNYKELSKQVYQYTMDGELVKIWLSSAECGRNGFNRGHIVECCNGKRKTHKGFIWRYKEE